MHIQLLFRQGDKFSELILTTYCIVPNITHKMYVVFLPLCTYRPSSNMYTVYTKVLNKKQFPPLGYMN